MQASPASACVYGKERLPADDTLPASAFMRPADAARAALARHTRQNVELVGVRRMTWLHFAWSRCTGVSDRRVVYVVRLRFPRGFIFSHGIYEPGTLVDEVVDARTGERFIGHTMGRVTCFAGGPPRANPPTPSPACVARYHELGA